MGKVKFSLVHTNEYLCHGLKNGDSVIIIHKDDFAALLRCTRGFYNFKEKYYNMIDVLISWIKSY